MARKTASTGDIVKLKVTLDGMRPLVWRRLLIPAEMTLDNLHIAIQAAMGWENAHLHAFQLAGDRYGDPTDTDNVDDEEDMTLAGVLQAGISRFKFTCDFGDDWNPSHCRRGHHPARGRPALPGLHCRQARLSVAGLRRPLWICQHARDQGQPIASRSRRYPGVEADFDPDAFSVADAAVAARARRPVTR